MPAQIGFALAYAASATISIAAALAIFRRREARGGRPLAWLLLFAALWALCDAVELQVTTVEGKRLVSQLQYLGVVSCAPLFVHAAMELARLEARLTPAVLAAIWGVPLMSLGMAWTSRWHQLLWTSIELPPDGSLFAVYHYGPWFWVLTAQHYLLTLVGTLVLLSARRKVTRAFRAPMLGVVIAVAIAWTGNALYVFKLGPWPGLNYLTMSLGLSGTVLAWVVVREGLLDLLPRAREALLETIADGVVVVDRADRIIFANAAASDHLSLQPGSPVLPERFRTPERVRPAAPWVGEIAIAVGPAAKWIDVRIDPVFDRWGDAAGRLIVTRDITVRKVLEDERERLIEQLKAALSKVSTLEELLPICASCKKVRDDKGYWSQIDEYLRVTAAVEFTHGICPECYVKLYGKAADTPRDQ